MAARLVLARGHPEVYGRGEGQLGVTGDLLRVGEQVQARVANQGPQGDTCGGVVVVPGELHRPAAVVRLSSGTGAGYRLPVGRAGVAPRAVVRAAAVLAATLLLPAQPPRLGSVGRPGPSARRLVADLPQKSGQLAFALLHGALVNEAREVGCRRFQGFVLVEAPRDRSDPVRLLVLQAGSV